MIARRLNPEKDSCDVNIPQKPRASINNNATISGRRTFLIRSNAAMPNNRNIISICVISTATMKVAHVSYIAYNKHEQDFKIK
jgi:hypothetical protein